MSKSQKTEPGKAAPASAQPNAWIVKMPADAVSNVFSATVSLNGSMAPALAEGDGIVLLCEHDGTVFAATFARLYQIRAVTDSVTIYFDAVLAVEPMREAATLGLPVSTAQLSRGSIGRFSPLP